MIKRISSNPEKKNKNKKSKNKDSPAAQDERQIIVVNNIQLPSDQDQDLRTITLYGDISEKKAGDVTAALLYLENSSHTLLPEDPAAPRASAADQKILARSISLIISTHWGTASDMLSILDIMDMVKSRTCDIETFGIGKVMSAGVPILAAGTKGQRRIGRNCRIMLHNVMAGSQGTIFSMENELDEIRWVQERYIECLSSYTNLTPSKIKKLLKSQKDVFISAEVAIKMGFADVII